MKRLIITLLVPVCLLAVGCNKKEEPKEPVDPQKQAQIEEQHKKFEEYKGQLSIFCVKPVTDISAIELAQCKDLKDNSEFYDLFGGRLSDTDLSYLPEACKRKVSELTANEIVDCLADKPESEENPFE